MENKGTHEQKNSLQHMISQIATKKMSMILTCHNTVHSVAQGLDAPSPPPRHSTARNEQSTPAPPPPPCQPMETPTNPHHSMAHIDVP